MNRIEFKGLMTMLVEEYTVEGRDPPYGPGRVEEIFQAFNLYNAPQFEAVIRRAFVSFNRAPTVKEIVDIGTQIRSEEHERTKTSQKYISHNDDGLPKEESLQRVGGIIEQLRRRYPNPGGEDGQSESSSGDLREDL